MNKKYDLHASCIALSLACTQLALANMDLARQFEKCRPIFEKYEELMKNELKNQD